MKRLIKILNDLERQGFEIIYREGETCVEKNECPIISIATGYLAALSYNDFERIAQSSSLKPLIVYLIDENYSVGINYSPLF